MNTILKTVCCLGVGLLVLPLMPITSGLSPSRASFSLSTADIGYTVTDTGYLSESIQEEIFASIPFSFIPNQGQVDEQAMFYAHTPGYTLWLSNNGLVFDRLIQSGENVRQSVQPLHGLGSTASRTRDVSRLQFVGANPNPVLAGKREQEHRVSFFHGSDPSKWKSDIRTYSEVTYSNVYRDIDLRVYGQQSRIQYDWDIHPGGNPGHIRFQYQGALKTGLTPEGDLLVETAFGRLRHTRPVSFQVIAGKHVPVETTFKQLGRNEFGFRVGDYDRTQTLTIDPLVYSTYLGGSNHDEGRAIAVDSNGHAYVAGWTRSTDFPTTTGAYDVTYRDRGDVFITKFNSNGTGLVYSTFMGGSHVDVGLAIAVDSNGHAYVAGRTSSVDFPTTAGAYDQTFNGGTDDAFIAKVNASGTGLIYSTYLGGNRIDACSGIAVDKNGNAHVTGATYSEDFPATSNAFKKTYSGDRDAFITKLNNNGTALVYSTFLGGSREDRGSAIALDSNGNAYVTGSTISTDFPVTEGAYGTSRIGNFDVFVSKLNAAGNMLVYSTYLGGVYVDHGYGVAVDSEGFAYVTGCTLSPLFPTTAGAYDQTHNGGDDVFVTKLNADGTALVYSTFLGGESGDYGWAIAVNSYGNASVTGSTRSADFPTTDGAYDRTFNSLNWWDNDAFITKLKANGRGLLYSTYLGGSATDDAYAIAVDDSGGVYVTGSTWSPDFPVAFGAFGPSLPGVWSAFVSQLSTPEERETMALPGLLLLLLDD